MAFQARVAPGKSLTDASDSLTDAGESLTDASVSLTDASESLTDASESLTDASDSLTDASKSLTDASDSLTAEAFAEREEAFAGPFLPFSRSPGMESRGAFPTSGRPVSPRIPDGMRAICRGWNEVIPPERGRREEPTPEGAATAGCCKQLTFLPFAFLVANGHNPA